jgi:hypothetical protein
MGLGIAVGFLLAGAARATVQVDCDTPDDFCLGDPCITTDSIEITVASCVLDFSPRALVLAEKVEVPNGGALSLTAGSIEVQKLINGKHVSSLAGDGADVSLIATGNIVVGRRIDVSGRLTNGTILLDAGANVELNQRLRARAKGSGATATGGTVTVQADGVVTSIKKGKIEVRGKKNSTAAGVVTVSGQNGVALAGRIDARGTPGGTVTVGSPAGTVDLSEEIRAGGEDAAGGSVTLTAAGGLNGPTSIVSVSGDGAAGGSVLMNASGLIDFHIVNALGLEGGTVAATAGDIVMKTARVRGSAGDAGVISLTSTSGGAVVSRLDGRSRGGTGGQADVTAAGNVSIIDAFLDGVQGGELHVDAGGDVELKRHFDVSGTVGGEIEAVAMGNLTAEGDFSAAVGGCIGLSAGLVLDTFLATFDVPLTASCP